jgi:AcrR family transcriptional regulator
LFKRRAGMARKNKLTSAGRDAFISAVLEMLDEGTVLRDLNLRKVARRIGCAHTNAYNYFGSFEELLWWSLREALERMIAFAAGDERAAAGTDETTAPGGGNLMEGYVDFALQHPAWYRLIWIEPLGGEAPREVAEYLDVPSSLYTEWLAAYTGLEKSDAELAAGGRILHGYVHGELAAISSGRVRTRPANLRSEVLTHTVRLFALLFPGMKFFLKKGV